MNSMEINKSIAGSSSYRQVLKIVRVAGLPGGTRKRGPIDTEDVVHLKYKIYWGAALCSVTDGNVLYKFISNTILIPACITCAGLATPLQTSIKP